MSLPIAVLIMAISGMLFGYIGYIIGADKREAAEWHMTVSVGRHAASRVRVPRCPLDTGELTVLHEVELAHFDREMAQSNAVGW